ncbi:hypothetical protein [Paenibacillus illinoisensis]|uniref:hypothetical protein n=1 Tax=Paenibacillus illinoisensis TaxID=59845 RepID=UPI00383B38FA
MKKSDWFKVILIFSLLGNLAFFQNHERAGRKQEIKNELLNSSIYRDLAQLEETIQYQIEHNWQNETLVTEKLDDAIDSIILNHEWRKTIIKMIRSGNCSSTWISSSIVKNFLM